MNQKPKVFALVAIALCLTAISFPLQVATAYNVSALELGYLFSMLTKLNLISMALMLTSAALLFRVSSWAKWALPLTLLCVYANNYAVSAEHINFSLEQTLWASVGFTVLLSPVFMPKPWRLLGQPQLRWWLRSPRIKSEKEIILGSSSETNQRLLTYDISESGLFAALDHKATLNFEVGEKIPVTLKLSDQRLVECHAKVVRRTTARGEYPDGLGMEFIDLSRADKRALAELN